jgi:hypothetical protein
MTFQQELASWFAPKGSPATETPSMGFEAPQSPKLELSCNPTIITFLRHCGCPFAEKTFLNLREIAKSHRSTDFIAVSHSSNEATQTWLKSLPQHGSEPDNLRVVVDESREIYSAWGLGVSGYAHVLSPASMYQVWKLGREHNIWNRPTESGSRWQTSGSFAVDADGIVRWGGPASRADDVPTFKEAVTALEGNAERASL